MAKHSLQVIELEPHVIQGVPQYERFLYWHHTGAPQSPAEKKDDGIAISAGIDEAK